MSLTVMIPVKAPAPGLSSCLEAVSGLGAEDVVVVASGDPGELPYLCRSRGARLLRFDWDGRFPKKRNWFLTRHTPSTKWVLFLDDDEVVGREFCGEVARTLPSTEHAGFWLNYSVHFMGRRLRGGYPLKKLALFRVGSGLYERIEEDHWSHLDMEVHEHPVLAGSTGQIQAVIEHHDDRDITHYVAKHNEYSSWEARRIIALYDNHAERARWTWRQRLKYSLLRSPLAGPAYFFGSYIVMGGWRDGARGLAFAILKAAYFTQVFCKVEEAGAAEEARLARDPAGTRSE